MSHIPTGLLAGLIGVPLILSEFWLIYVVLIYTEKAERWMPTSSFVRSNINAYSQAGLVGKVMRNGFLTLVLLIPEISSKRGIVNLDEVKKFPKGLKLLLLVSWGLCTLLVSALMILWLYTKYLE